ncbi:MAG: hypothetical protein C4527_21305 [Candidatus Omnitrophota bacterium]|nr:MAG: hypothetical protein C4527_21305 [Candidatus Omnitrophota bacterium]
MLNAAGLEAYRLVLSNFNRSPHTLSLVQIEGDWIPLDPSYGLVLKSAISGKPATYAQLLENPATIQPFGIYSQLAETFQTALPSMDFELEAHIPRMYVLANHLKEFLPFDGFSRAFTPPQVPRFDANQNKAGMGIGGYMTYIFNMSHQQNEYNRQLAKERYGDLIPLRPGRLFLLAGEYAKAQSEFQHLLEQTTLSRNAREDAEYYLALIAFEQNEFSQARRRFLDVLARYPHSNWKNRIDYQLAWIAYKQGSGEFTEMIKKSGQDNEGSLFQRRCKPGFNSP